MCSAILREGLTEPEHMSPVFLYVLPVKSRFLSGTLKAVLSQVGVGFFLFGEFLLGRAGADLIEADALGLDREYGCDDRA